jgi:hypothetical protein
MLSFHVSGGADAEVLAEAHLGDREVGEGHRQVIVFSRAVLEVGSAS